MKCIVQDQKVLNKFVRKTVLLTTDKEINDRWIEHFSDLLNIETDTNMEVLNEIEQMPIDQSIKPFN